VRLSGGPAPATILAQAAAAGAGAGGLPLATDDAQAARRASSLAGGGANLSILDVAGARLW
jgi:hypothetical protein